MAGTRPQARNNHPLTRAAGPVVPGPNSVPTPPRPSEPGDSSFHTPARHPGQHPEHPFQAQYYKDHRPVRPGALFVDVPPMSNPPVHTRDRHGHLMDHPATPAPSAGRDGHALLRKEVIQPHLPVRLPCYDLVPIASPTFDGSPHKGWATGFGCYRLS
jgi:hypothetical protein